MSEYTYKNVIIDPTSEDAESCLGKMVYFADTPSECLYHANNNVDYYMELKAIDTDSNYPFILENNLYCSCIILCKEDLKPKYVSNIHLFYDLGLLSFPFAFIFQIRESGSVNY